MKTDLNLKAEYMATFPDIAGQFPNIEAASRARDEKRAKLALRVSQAWGLSKSLLPPCACEMGVHGTGFFCQRCSILDVLEDVHDHLTD